MMLIDVVNQGVTYAAVAKFLESKRMYTESIYVYHLARRNNAQINFTLAMHSIMVRHLLVQ